jgi:hypothetical protein
VDCGDSAPLLVLECGDSAPPSGALDCGGLTPLLFRTAATRHRFPSFSRLAQSAVKPAHSKTVAVRKDFGLRRLDTAFWDCGVRRLDAAFPTLFLQRAKSRHPQSAVKPAHSKTVAVRKDFGLRRLDTAFRLPLSEFRSKNFQKKPHFSAFNLQPLAFANALPPDFQSLLPFSFFLLPFQKMLHFLLTWGCGSGILTPHTVTTTTLHMRTKTLLTAIAALAIGVTITKAQVYSANVVGYAQGVIPGNAYSMFNTPFAIGVSNGANEVFPNLPAKTTILVYSTAATNVPLSNVGQQLGVNGNESIPAQSYITYYYDPQYVGLGYGAWWDDGNYDDNVPAPSLPVGEAFFILAPSSFTNTFSGAVAVNVGATNTMTLPGNAYSMVGSVIPYSGDITTGNAGALTNNLPAQSTVLVYFAAAGNIPLSNVGQQLGVNGNESVPAQSYATYYYDPQYVSLGYGAWWDDGNYDDNVPAPSLGVGQGMFILPAGTFNWQQTLQSQ